jgi:hypothetical protein
MKVQCKWVPYSCADKIDFKDLRAYMEKYRKRNPGDWYPQIDSSTFSKHDREYRLMRKYGFCPRLKIECVEFGQCKRLAQQDQKVFDISCQNLYHAFTPRSC